MFKLILGAFLFLCGLAGFVFAITFSFFAPVQYLSLDDADVPPEILARVWEGRVPAPDLGHLTQVLRVPGTSEVWFTTKPGALGEKLRFGLAPLWDGTPIRYRIYLFDGKDKRKIVFDSEEHPGQGRDREYAATLPRGDYKGGLIFATNAESPKAVGRWFNLRIEHRYARFWIVSIILVAAATWMLVWWWRGTPAAERPRGLGRLGLLGVALVLAAAAAEAGIRKFPAVLGVQSLWKLEFPRTVPKSVLDYCAAFGAPKKPDPAHPDIGWRLKRNSRSAVLLDLGAIYVLGGTVWRPRRTVVEGDFFTDDRGFPNRRTLSKADVTVLGDSFCEGLPTDVQWPTMLAAETGREVCNFGMRGFSTIQERAVYEHVARKLGSKVVILLFFEGNDLGDNKGMQNRLAQGAPAAGTTKQETDAFFREVTLKQRPRFKNRRNADCSLLLFKVLEMLGPLAGPMSDPFRFDRPFHHDYFNSREPGTPSGGGAINALTLAARCNRISLFNSGRPVPKAFYFGDVADNSWDIEAVRAGDAWKVTKAQIQRLHQLVREDGAKLFVVNVPIDLRVYLPILLRSMGRAELAEYFRIIAACGYNDARLRAVDLDIYEKNGPAVSTLLSQLCKEEGIQFLDLHSALLEAAEKGIHPYFEDDTHLNVEGQKVVARTIAELIKPALGH